MSYMPDDPVFLFFVIPLLLVALLFVFLQWKERKKRVSRYKDMEARALQLGGRFVGDRQKIPKHAASRFSLFRLSPTGAEAHGVMEFPRGEYLITVFDFELRRQRETSIHQTVAMVRKPGMNLPHFQIKAKRAGKHERFTQKVPGELSLFGMKLSLDGLKETEFQPLAHHRLRKARDVAESDLHVLSQSRLVSLMDMHENFSMEANGDTVILYQRGHVTEFEELPVFLDLAEKVAVYAEEALADVTKSSLSLTNNITVHTS